MNEKIWLNYNFHFVCPECGSSYFGSSLNKDGSLTRHCHGVGCKYEWHETKDNPHVFVSWQEVAYPTKRETDGLMVWVFKLLVAQIARVQQTAKKRGRPRDYFNISPSELIRLALRALDLPVCTCSTRPTPTTLSVDPKCPVHGSASQ